MSGGKPQFLDPANASARQAWDEVVRSSESGTVYHTTAWLDAIEKGFGLPSRFAYLSGPNLSIRALVPLFSAGGWARPVRWLNLPQGCAADPLAANEADVAQLIELLAASAAAEGSTAIILRTSRGLKATVPEGWEVRRENPLVRHVLDLTGAHDVSTLPHIQKGQKRIYRRVGRRLKANDTQVREVTRDEIGAFARAAHHILLRRHGHVGPPARFFKALVEFLPDATRLLLVCPQSGPPIAFSAMTMGSSDCHLLYGSGLPTDEGTDGYRFCVGLQIEAAIRKGLRMLDFGESGPQHHGLIYFKETWGAHAVDGSYQVIVRKGAPSGLNVLGKNFALAQRLLHHAPAGLSLRIAGPLHKALQ